MIEELVQKYGKTDKERDELIVSVKRVVEQTTKTEEKVRILLCGCFDIMHAGHFNALRQVKSILPNVWLVAGVHSDAQILPVKGPTVMKDDERLALVRACKWVDEVVFDVPYKPITTDLLDQYNCQYCAHGDDFPRFADGSNMYQPVIDAGRFQLFKRTEGVSTTRLINKLLEVCGKLDTKEEEDPSYSGASLYNFLPTAQRIIQFGNKKNPTRKIESIVYCCGDFDMLHVGHVNWLKKIRKLGDFLLVGTYSDEAVKSYKGAKWPVMSLHERILNLLSIKYVDDVIIGAPLTISRDMLTVMNIKVVAVTPEDFANRKPYYYAAQERGVLKTVEMDNKFSVDDLVTRVLDNSALYIQRNQKKMQVEEDYTLKRKFVEER